MTGMRMFAVLCVSLSLTLGVTSSVPAQEPAKGVDPFLPADTESLVRINLKQILDSALVKKQALPALKDALKDLGEVNDFLADIGLDPFKDVERLVIAGSAGTDTDRGLIVAYGKFDNAKITKKMTAMSAGDDAVVKVQEVPLGAGAKHTVWEVSIPGSEKPMFAALVDDGTMLVSPGKDYVVDALKQHRAKKKPELKNKEFQALLEKLDAKQSISLAMLGKNLAPEGSDDPIMKVLVDAFGGIEAIGGGLTLGTEIKLDLAIAGKSNEAADKVRENLEQGVRLGKVGLLLVSKEQKALEVLLEVLNTVKIGGRGKVVSLSARLTVDVLDEFFKKDN